MKSAAPLFILATAGLASALGTLEMELPVSSPRSPLTMATLVLTFPDSLAGTDLRALVLSGDSLRSKSLLPGGKLRPEEREFLSGLRDFLAGRFGLSAETWSGLRKKPLSPILKSCLNVNAGLFAVMRGDIPAAESLWIEERQTHSFASEGAWRNRLGLLMSRNSYKTAYQLLDEVLAANPRNRHAVLGMAALLKSTRSDSEWEAFLLKKSSSEDSLPELQLVYGEFLVHRGRFAEGVRILDRGLAALPRNGRSWKILAEAQYKLGYHYFALDCLNNAAKTGYREADMYELFAKVLITCCMGAEDPRAASARQTAEKLLEEGLPHDLHRRSMAQILYLVYCQNFRPEAAKNLENSLWFHFQGPSQRIPPLINALSRDVGLNSQGLSIPIGLYSFTWLSALRNRDFYRAY